MLFSILHLPPLPAAVERVEQDENIVCGETAESSHALIGNLIEWVSLLKNHRRNGERMAEQLVLVSQFKAELLKLDLRACSDESLYDFYCHHTRRWVGCYVKGLHMRFLPADYVSSNDKIHRNMVDYCKAQFHHFTEGREELSLEPTVRYLEMLRKCAEWGQAAFGQDAC